MKLLCIIQCTNLGGMEQSTLLFLREFRSMGHEVELISLNDVGALGPKLTQHGISSDSVGYHGKYGWRSFLPLWRLLHRRSPDAVIMVGHNLMAMLALGGIGRGRRILDLHFHHRGVLPIALWRILYTVGALKFQFLTFPSKFIMDEALEFCPFLRSGPKGKCRVIGIPVELGPYLGDRRRECREKLGLPVDAFLVGNGGWLIPRKRLDIFLTVAAEVAKQVPRARFVIAGDGPARPELEALAEKLGISHLVIWLGWQDDMWPFYKSLDVLLFNSDWDAMGRTPLEAMARAIPVVASVLHGGLGEVLIPSCGTLLHEHNIPVLTEAVVSISRDDSVADKVRLACRARIAELCSPEAHAVRLFNLLTRKKPL